MYKSWYQCFRESKVNQSNISIVIPNWDDIVDLCAKDRATGLGAENALDADDIMSKETKIK